VKLGRISLSSPIGHALMGRVAGDEVSVNIPSGKKNYEIVSIIPYHETEQDL